MYKLSFKVYLSLIRLILCVFVIINIAVWPIVARKAVILYIKKNYYNTTLTH